MRTKPHGTKLPVEKIRTDGGTQMRVSVSQDAIDRYADFLREDDGNELPPGVVFKDKNGDYWAADIFQRLEAYRLAGRTHIPAHIKEGSLDDAIVYALGANADHGVPRTIEDRRNAVKVAVGMMAAKNWNGADVRRICRVSPHLVEEARAKAENRPSTYDKAKEKSKILEAILENPKSSDERIAKQLGVAQERVKEVRDAKNATKVQESPPVSEGARSSAPRLEQKPKATTGRFTCTEPDCDAKWDDRQRWHCSCGNHWEPELERCDGCGGERPMAASCYTDIEEEPDDVVPTPYTRQLALADSLTAAYDAPRPATVPEPDVDDEPTDDGARLSATEGPKDCTGRLLPAKLVPIFEALREHQAVENLLNQAKRLAEELAGKPHARFHLQTFETDLANAKSQIHFNRPYAVCPYCDATNTQCSACKSSGWVNKSTFEQAPKKENAA